VHGDASPFGRDTFTYSTLEDQRCTDPTALFDAPAHMLSGGSIDDLESRARRVKDDAALRDRLVLNYVASREPYPLSPHIEERIYKGFPGQNDEARMAASIKPLGRITSRSCRASRMSGCGGSGFASFTSKHAHSFPRGAVGGRGPLGGSTCRRRHRLPYLRAGLAETERLLSEAVDADGLLAQYRLYLQERSARAAAFRARRVAGVSVQSDFRASEIRESS
jgi:exodeoxyribonuclease-1